MQRASGAMPVARAGHAAVNMRMRGRHGVVATTPVPAASSLRPPVSARPRPGGDLDAQPRLCRSRHQLVAVDGAATFTVQRYPRHYRSAIGVEGPVLIIKHASVGVRPRCHPTLGGTTVKNAPGRCSARVDMMATGPIAVSAPTAGHRRRRRDSRPVERCGSRAGGSGALRRHAVPERSSGIGPGSRWRQSRRPAPCDVVEIGKLQPSRGDLAAVALGPVRAQLIGEEGDQRAAAFEYSPCAGLQCALYVVVHAPFTSRSRSRGLSW